MHIAIDARAFAWTGIGRYIRNLLVGLAQLPNAHSYTVLIPRDSVDDFARLRRQALDRRFTAIIVEKSYYSWREQTIFLWQLSRLKADLFHFTHFNQPLLFRRPSVVTIHDTTRFIFPGEKRQNILQQLAYELVFAHAVKQANAVICVSRTTEQELATLPLKLPNMRAVIYEGVESRFFEPPIALDRQKIRMLLGIEDPYILTVGVWMSHKNIPRLLEAFAVVGHEHPSLKLVLTGKPKPGYSNVISLTKKLAIEANVIFAGFVPEELLPALYAEARILVFPSLYEGFGLPPLEAAACGTPVIASNISSMPEIMGEGAYAINPEYTPGLSKAIGEILTNEALRQRLITLGKARARTFSWEEAARAHVRVYEEAIRHA